MAQTYTKIVSYFKKQLNPPTLDIHLELETESSFLQHVPRGRVAHRMLLQKLLVSFLL